MVLHVRTTHFLYGFSTSLHPTIKTPGMHLYAGKSNSFPKSQAMSGVGSPATVSNMSVLLYANSPSVGTPPLADQSILDRFGKIETVAQRHQLNCKKNKVYNFPPKKPVSHSSQQLQMCLSDVSNYEDFKVPNCVTCTTIKIVYWWDHEHLEKTWTRIISR
ncbi:hypothetical protein MKW92_044052 [Papaver armeniacum]|nr:hypothetical protein MKW92_044052 [Papaver armeniacum]